jgi:hypothetical protein
LVQDLQLFDWNKHEGRMIRERTESRSALRTATTTAGHQIQQLKGRPETGKDAAGRINPQPIIRPPVPL